MLIGDSSSTSRSIFVIEGNAILTSGGIIVGNYGMLEMRGGRHIGDVALDGTDARLLATAGLGSRITGDLTLNAGSGVTLGNTANTLTVTGTSTVKGNSLSAGSIQVGNADASKVFSTTKLVIDATSANANVTANTTTVGTGGEFEMKSAGTRSCRHSI